MKIVTFVFLFMVGTLSAVRADQAVANAQQVLKDQGFYYGEVTGEKNADTSAAIRRFQIRNGLEITGELNEETQQALRKAPAPTPVPATTAAPAAPTGPVAPVPRSDSREENGEPDNDAGAGQVAPFPAGPGVGEPPIVYPGRPAPGGSGPFVGTPYDNAPPQIQRRVVLDAQRILARHGLFKHPPDGSFGPDMEFSLRAYQARIGLRPTGRLDLETLAALELLPGRREPIYTPRHRLPPGVEPPVRGEWIRP